VIYVPLTTQYRNSEYEVVLPNLKFLNQSSIANVQGIASIPTARLERKLGDLPIDVMLQIKKAIIFALDLSLYSGFQMSVIRASHS
jgi:mRNA interferase MazF